MTDQNTLLTESGGDHSFRVNSVLTHTFARFGLPLEKSTFKSINALKLNSSNHEEVKACFTPASYWADGSLKWVTIEALLQDGCNYSISRNTEDQHQPSIANKHFSLQGTTLTNKTLGCSFDLASAINAKTNAQWTAEIVAHSCNNLRESISVQLSSTDIDKVFISLTLRHALTTNQLEISTLVENKRATAQSDGKWDLGDSNSVFFDHLTLTLTTINHTQQPATLHITDSSTGNKLKTQANEFTLTQYASGGENWQSINHVNAHKELDIEKNGFELRSSSDCYTGKRAECTLECHIANEEFFIQPQDFWQNFPCALTLCEQTISVQYFLNSTELQPGESKSWTLLVTPKKLFKHSKPARIEYGAIHYNATYIDQTKVLPAVKLANHEKTEQLIRLGIEGDHSYYQKREFIDEYGWRHYGELYADHETLYSDQPSSFASHYNNQYDPAGGLLIQYLKSPGADWAGLIYPLIRHVMDIDIYNTDDDKPEYNGGLFWHTDHYLPAETVTHRTYSKYHQAVYEGYQGGGGPGGQHCYTTGLKLYALMHGDKRASDKVIQLTKWVRRFYNGNHSLLGRLHRYISIDRKPNQLTNVGLVYPGYKYPLDRGTGNYLTALIDCFELTHDAALVQEMAYVIQNTVGLGDDLSDRNLLNIEENWFYTVFLQAIIKYILLKIELDEFDDDMAYARAILEKYALWMAENEQPYLNTPEKLEFPNDTWAAQDIRKAYIFYFSGLLFSENSDLFTDKSETFLNYVVGKLENSKEASTTRILAILMQNSSFIGAACDTLLNVKSWPALPEKFKNYKGVSANRRFIKEFISLVPEFSITTEWCWLSTRIGKLRKLRNKR
jgi:hypothetical protein